MGWSLTLSYYYRLVWIVAILIGIALLLSSYYDVVGPGYLSYANPGVLERVAEKRIRLGWGLTKIDIQDYDALVAVEDCGLLGREGWLLTDIHTEKVLVVDCQNRQETPRMSEVNLLADINVEELVHSKGWLLLK